MAQAGCNLAQREGVRFLPPLVICVRDVSAQESRIYDPFAEEEGKTHFSVGFFFVFKKAPQMVVVWLPRTTQHSQACSPLRLKIYLDASKRFHYHHFWYVYILQRGHL